MKIQELAIIFIIIILPISLLLSEYTQFQIETINTQTVYDSKLTAATYDAIKAYQLNEINSSTSDLDNSKMRDIEASVSSFRNSIMSAFKLNGYTEEALNNYIPALVYTLYDGFYIYSPYENENHRYEVEKDALGNDLLDSNGNPIYTNTPKDGNGDSLYGIKPFINYSIRYKKPEKDIDVVITYALDNHITVQGTMPIQNEDGSTTVKYINDAGYLIDNIKVDYTTDEVIYNGVTIEKEELKEYIPLNINGKNLSGNYRYAKINDTKYYLVENYDENGKAAIIYFLNGVPIVQCKQPDEGKDDEQYTSLSQFILNNDRAKRYYKAAEKFTEWFKSTGLKDLEYCDAYDEVIDSNGDTKITRVWGEEEHTKIFDFDTDQLDENYKNIENESSNFNQHRLAVLRHKIETNLAIAIANYNSYSGAALTNEFQMPELKEDEWEHITHNISLISFLQGLPIGGKIYNGYSIVNNSESKEVVLEENIFILSRGLDGSKTYRRVGDNGFKNDTADVNSGHYGTEASAGRLNIDFKKNMILNSENTGATYYYPLQDYNGSYESIVMQEDVTTYDDIYEYVNQQEEPLKKAFYIALARERAGKFNNKINSAVGGDEDSFLPEVWYKITYNANRPNGIPDNYTLDNIPEQQVKRFGIKVQLLPISGDKPTLTGHKFKGWSRTQGGDAEDKYAPGEWYDGNEDLNLFAIWDINKYWITYHHQIPDDADESTLRNMPPNYSKKYGEIYTILSNPTLDGYVFQGFAKDHQLSETILWAGNTINDDRAIDLYAKWVRAEYKITYDLNVPLGTTINNFPEIPQQIKKYKQDIQLFEQRPQREGYEFLGWSTIKGGNEDENYNPGKLYTTDADLDLYAVWAKKYTITYDANGGNGAPEQQIKLHGRNITLSDKVPTRTGYTFLGWATKANATTKQYSAGDTYSDNGNATLYAVWSANEYTITYDANNGDGAPPKQKWKYGNSVTLSGTKPTRVGYGFQGWSTESNATTPTYFAGKDATDLPAKDITLYAVWKINDYTITFNANGGTGGPTSQNKPHGVTIKLTSSIPNRKGYTFYGWATSPSATSEQYRPGGEYSKDGSVTLYAVWKTTLYEIAYDANGGKGEPDCQIKTHGVDIKLSKTKPTREGHNFLGWGESPTGPVKYQPEANYTNDDAIVLYAIWSAHTYTISFNANGGSGAPSAQTKTYGIDLTLPSKVPTNTGYDFVGWASSATATSAEYSAGGKYSKEGKATLYAVWKKAEYIIKYDANYGNGAPSQQTKIHGENLTLSSNQPTRSGYNFLGWAETPTATSIAYKAGGTYSKNESATLYAVWDSKKYTITYDGNGGTGAPEPQVWEYKNSNQVTLSSKQPTRKGYTFKGWTKTKGSTTVNYKPGVKYGLALSDMTLYAVWSANTYTLKYDANGGSGAPSSKTVTFGSTITLASTKPTWTNHNFLGWATTNNATAAEYQPGDKFTVNNENPVLYAVWIETYTITYNVNGGTGTIAKQTKIHGEDLKLSETKPTKTNYNFLGWATTSTATSPEYKSGGTYSKNESATLYAVWDSKKYTVTYYANGGDGAPENQIKEHGKSLTLSSTAPTRTGYTFKGWAKSSTATTVAYQQGATYSTNADLSLYAVWSANTYTLKYDANGGSGAPNSQSVTFGKTITLSSTKPKKDGANFLGWATTKDATKAEYQPGGQFTVNMENPILYAVWEVTTYTLTYHFNGGTQGGIPGTQTWKHGETLILAYVGEEEYPTKSGYIFNGWCEEVVADHQDHYPGKSLGQVNKNLDLYAVWQKLPYLPNGYIYKEGNFQTGIVIEHKTLGNEFVWVEVPKTTTVYKNAGLNITNFTNAYAKIESDLKNYVESYRYAATDEYSSYASTGITSSKYSEIKNIMLKSIYQNAGFYIGRYETGIEDEPRTSSSQSITSYDAVIKQNVYPYNCVTSAQAMKLAINFSTNDCTTSLPFGLQWNLVLKHIEVKAVEKGIPLETIYNELRNDAREWGNYNISLWNVTNNNAKYFKSHKWNEGSYNKTTKESIILSTGANDKFSKMRIYDLAGNVYEWTLEKAYNLTGRSVSVGGSGYSTQISGPATRGSMLDTESDDYIGFRVVLYKK